MIIAALSFAWACALSRQGSQHGSREFGRVADEIPLIFAGLFWYVQRELALNAQLVIVLG
jgi:hypothetical protein